LLVLALAYKHSNTSLLWKNECETHPCGHSTPRGKEKRIGMVLVPDDTWKVVRQEDTKLTGAQELLQKQNEFGLNSETASHARFEWCENSIC